jgi:hypothetical protein
VESLPVVSLVVAVLALVLTVVALRRTQRPRGGGADELPEDVQGLRQEVAALKREAGDALRHLAVVRYDAFGDMGGRLSFSAALFDDEGNGLVISSINGRSETRTYAKPLVDLRSDHTLSPEEEEAITHARP